MRIKTTAIVLLLLALPVSAAPPNSWPADFSATVTLSGVTEREHFVWQDTAWRNDPGVWDLVLIPPDVLSAFVLIDFDGDANVALYLGGDGQFVVDDAANSVRDVSPAFVPEPAGAWLMAGMMLLMRRRRRELSAVE